MIDFQKLYHEFMDEWIEKNAGKYTDEDEISQAVADAYEEWLNHSYQELNGLSPRQYFANIDDPKALMDMLIGYSICNEEIPSVLLDRIVEVQGATPYLTDILKRQKNDELTMYAINILNEMSSEEPFDIYIDWIFNPEIDKDLRDIAAEVLAENALRVKDRVVNKLKDADFSSKEYASDILVRCPKDERIFNLLKELFLSAVNYQLYANYLGQYGDERAVKLLLEAAKTCDYISFLEIRNAVEQLGADFGVERDFSQDKYFQKLKLNNKS
ncbi:MAG TPA: hypothetical protein GX745_05530 [Clostridiales bacterium]|nr:hypothetical protein [Clostridiales bacterium]